MDSDIAKLNRADALSTGKKRFLGEICNAAAAHATDSGAWRYTSSGRCCECDHERIIKFREKKKITQLAAGFVRVHKYRITKKAAE